MSLLMLDKTYHCIVCQIILVKGFVLNVFEVTGVTHGCLQRPCLRGNSSIVRCQITISAYPIYWWIIIWWIQQAYFFGVFRLWLRPWTPPASCAGARKGSCWYFSVSCAGREGASVGVIRAWQSQKTVCRFPMSFPRIPRNESHKHVCLSLGI